MVEKNVVGFEASCCHGGTRLYSMVSIASYLQLQLSHGLTYLWGIFGLTELNATISGRTSFVSSHSVRHTLEG